MLRIVTFILVIFVTCKESRILEGQQTLEPSADARILHYEFDNTGVGPYQFSFKTSDGIERTEVGEIKYPNTEKETLVVSGSYSYIGPDGIEYSVKYTADENGFHPEGTHIEVPSIETIDSDDLNQNDQYDHTEDPALPDVVFENGIAAMKAEEPTPSIFQNSSTPMEQSNLTSMTQVEHIDEDMKLSSNLYDVRTILDIENGMIKGFKRNVISIEDINFL